MSNTTDGGGNMFGNIQEFINKGDNHDKLIWLLIGVIAGGVIGFLIKLILDNLWKIIKVTINITIKGISKLFSTVSRKIKSAINVMREKKRYKLIIKKIEEKETEIPPYFLMNKTRDSNPELKKIYRMMDDGVLELPLSEKVSKHFKR
jgi:hypothetical protein